MNKLMPTSTKITPVYLWRTKLLKQCVLYFYMEDSTNLEALCFMVVLQNQVLLEEKKTFLLWLYIVSQYTILQSWLTCLPYIWLILADHEEWIYMCCTTMVLFLLMLLVQTSHTTTLTIPQYYNYTYGFWTRNLTYIRSCKSTFTLRT